MSIGRAKKVSADAYFPVPTDHYTGMSLCCVRDTAGMAETPWERLSRLVDLRRHVIGLTLDGIQAVGGPSPKSVQKLRMYDGPPSDRQRATLRRLDAALRWPPDTSWSIASGERDKWSAEMLEDEERSLLERVDESEEFAFVVAARLRALSHDERMDAMRRIGAILGVEA